MVEERRDSSGDLGENLGSGISEIRMPSLPDEGVQPITKKSVEDLSQLGGNDFVEFQIKFIDYVPPPR